MPISMAWALVYGVHSLYKHLSHTKTVDEEKIHLKFEPCINCNILYTLYINVTMHQKFILKLQTLTKQSILVVLT